MHAFLIIGNNIDQINLRVANLAEKLDAKISEYPLIKIEDVRNLNNLLRLSFNEKTLIVCKNIHETGEEALNAFLKNLEEPQDNIYFLLTAPSISSLLSTIVSRCQIIKIVDSKQSTVNSEETEKFMNMTKSEKLSLFEKIKERDKAVEFINNLIFYLHDKNVLSNMEILLTTLNNIKSNGNVSLHLTNLVARMEDA